MYKILTLNNLAAAGLDRLPDDKYQIGSDIQDPDAILLRSFKMHDMTIPSSLKAVGRAGSGVNNIPVSMLSEMGIPVFNAPGANANAVKELVLAGMLLASRNLCQGQEFAGKLEGNDEEITKQVEAGKKNFAGFELPGRTLGVIGLGAIGRLVANMALLMGMKVIGYDPKLTVEGAWKLSSEVKKAANVDELLAEVDYVTFHVPLIDDTRHMINAERLQRMKQNVVILNFARAGIVDDTAVSAAIKTGKVYMYVCDFPSVVLKNHPRVVALPHLGASTKEAEENCAIMVADQVREYLEKGSVVNSVNFPEVVMDCAEGYRISIVNSNVPNMVGQISTAMAKAGLNLIDMINKSKDEMAYTLADVDQEVPDAVVEEIAAIDGVLAVRKLN